MHFLCLAKWKIHRTMKASFCTSVSSIVSLIEKKNGIDNAWIKPSLLRSLAVVKTIADVRLCHAYFLKYGLHQETVLWNELMKTYGKFHGLVDCMEIFYRFSQSDVVSWNILIGAYAQHDQQVEAFLYFRQLLLEDEKPDRITFLNLLSACLSPDDLIFGKLIHASIFKHGLQAELSVQNALINMYGKCRSLDDALAVFEKMQHYNVISWTAIIQAHAQEGQHRNAVHVLSDMCLGGIKPNKVTFTVVLNTCMALEIGKLIHSLIIHYKLQADIVVTTALIDMYGKNCCLKDVWIEFGTMHRRNIISWTTMISMHAQQGDRQTSVQLYREMVSQGMQPNLFTYSCILNSIASQSSLAEAKYIHGQILRREIIPDIKLSNALVHTYGRCGSTETACMVFDQMQDQDIVSWNSIITAYVENSHYIEVLQIFTKIPPKVAADKITFIGVLDACANLEASMVGRFVHAWAILDAFAFDTVITAALVNMYSKCGQLEAASVVFESMHEEDVVLCTAMIKAYAQHGCNEECLRIFHRMNTRGLLLPDKILVICVLDACANMALQTEGIMIHSYTIEMRFDSDIVVSNALIDMYGKCGNLDEARAYFIKMPAKNTVSWNALFTACLQNGHGKEVLKLFKQMQGEGIRPNELTFMCILCSVGHLNEAYYSFSSMAETFGITPAIEHYGCLVDHIGRTGQFDELHDFIDGMPNQPNVVMWISIHSACKMFDVEDIYHSSSLDANNSASCSLD